LKDDNLHSFVGGGYVISPANMGKQSVVKHMLAMDWKCWRSYLKSSSAYSMTIQMLGRVAGSLLLLTIFILLHFIFDEYSYILTGLQLFYITGYEYT
jgi:hypothetical protein